MTKYVGPITEHFDGRKFHNFIPGTRTLWDVFKWRWNHKRTPWPKQRFISPNKEIKSRVSQGELFVTFVNHSTVLIQWDGMNILTDPIWSERCSPLSWLGPRRVHLPGIRLEDLPPLDLILVTHNHYDHMDIPTLKKLYAKHHPVILTGLGNRSFLKSYGMHKTAEMDWWQEFDFPNGLSVAYVPSQHFSGRTIWDRDQTLWGGFVLKKDDHLIYFAGDTGYGPHFEMIRERYGSPLLAFLSIGAFEPRWFMHLAHMSPEEALQAHNVLGAQESIAIHFGTFPLADEGLFEPLQILEAERKRMGIPEENFLILEPGQTHNVPLS